MLNVLITTDTRYPVNRKIIRKAVGDIFAKYKVSNNLRAEISVVVVGSRKMRELSEKYLHDDKKHEVLAFALEDVASESLRAGNQGFINPPDNILRLGDVVLCWPEVLAKAANDNKMVDDEVYFLIVHGTEHLLGEHHE